MGQSGSIDPGAIWRALRDWRGAIEARSGSK
jgi:hypothetical protein